MFTPSGTLVPSVLIVQNKSGNVFIVENPQSQSQVEKILKNDPNKSKSRRKSEDDIQVKTRELSPIDIKMELDEIKEEPPDDDDDDDFNNDFDFEDSWREPTTQVPFIDPSEPFDEIQCKIEPSVEIEELSEQKHPMFEPIPPMLAYPIPESSAPSSSKYEYSAPEPTFDGRWSSDEADDYDDGFPDSDDEPLSNLKAKIKKRRRKSSDSSEMKSSSRDRFWSHKSQSLAGKIACKYCDVIFGSKTEQQMHVCKYLQCDPKNFICRVCGKELSKKTFSNHLHETLDCQLCHKKFVNPRAMRLHLERQHKGEKFDPPKTYKDRKLEQAMAPARPVYGEGQPVVEKKPRKRYPRKKERFECDLCGKYICTLRSMAFHMTLHTGETSYICENCGEKFYTPNGIKNHSCEKKRRRPEKDYRTVDLRHCRFCDNRFSSYDENKAHICPYQDQQNSKIVFCRHCGRQLKRDFFNRHMETHTGIDWVCGICDRKVVSERALKLHMTTHTGNKPYKCKLCTETFINKVVLDRHMRFHGEAPKLHRCEFCFVELSTETTLRRHIQRVHKPTAMCELCKIELPSREDLKEHLMTSHPPSICQVCNKSFALPRYLKMHEKLHFEDTTPRMQCPVCSKSLGMRNIKAHVYRHHRDQFDQWKESNPLM